MQEGDEEGAERELAAVEREAKVVAARIMPAYAKLFSSPIALVAVMLVWAFLALRYSGLPRARIGIWFAAMAIGVLLALPWGLAVLNSMGWDNIRAMLNNQGVECQQYSCS